jgi:hypothetical protein
MKPKPLFRVTAVCPDGQPTVILKQYTRYGAESVLRLIRHASPFAELRIEDDLENAVEPACRAVGRESTPAETNAFEVQMPTGF